MEMKFMAVDNKKMNAAKAAKKDEFYTQLHDIEEELQYYKQHFEDKVVYCNCDDPEWSNFWKFFHDNFKDLKLRKLIATYYTGEVPSKPSCKVEYDGETITRTQLEGNGDFRNPECIEILKESDIVVSNGPFSLFRSYMAQLFEHNKDFLVIGNMNAVTYKEVIEQLKQNKVRTSGYKNTGGMEFRLPDDYPLTACDQRIDENGTKFIKMRTVRWFTNLKSSKSIKPLELTETYSSEKYPKYDNYEAINVDKTAEIPLDYKGKMGVPISFIDKYNPEQFKVVDLM